MTSLRAEEWGLTGVCWVGVALLVPSCCRRPFEAFVSRLVSTGHGDRIAPAICDRSLGMKENTRLWCCQHLSLS